MVAQCESSGLGPQDLKQTISKKLWSSLCESGPGFNPQYHQIKNYELEG